MQVYNNNSHQVNKYFKKFDRLSFFLSMEKKNKILFNDFKSPYVDIKKNIRKKSLLRHIEFARNDLSVWGDTIGL